MKTSLALLALLAVLVAACGSGTALDLDGEWQLESGTVAGTAIPLVADHPITMTVDGERISGTAACNSYQGKVDRAGDSFVVVDVAVTEMACLPPEVMESEARFLDALTAATRAELADGRLVVRGADHELVFRHREG